MNNEIIIHCKVEPIQKLIAKCGDQNSPQLAISGLDLSRGGVENAFWQRDDQLHLTLAFIGDVYCNERLEIEGTLSTVQFTPFDMRLLGVGMFGRQAGYDGFAQPRALWAGVADKAPLANLHDKLNFALDRVGVRVEQRAFKPHVTLARFKKGTRARVRDWMGVNSALTTPSQTVGHFTLFSSELTASGSYYTPESRFGETAHGDDGD